MSYCTGCHKRWEYMTHAERDYCAEREHGSTGRFIDPPRRTALEVARMANEGDLGAAARWNVAR